MPISLETRSLLSDLDHLLKVEKALDAMVQRARLAMPRDEAGFEAFLSKAQAHFKSSLSESTGHAPLGAGALVSGLAREIRRLEAGEALLRLALERAEWPQELMEAAIGALKSEGLQPSPA